MQLQGQRWKKLINSQSGPNLDENQSQERSRSKKYEPKRQTNISQLSSMNLKSNRSRVTSNDASQPKQAERSIIMKSSFLKNEETEKRSPTRSDSDQNLLQTKLRQSISSQQQLASPTMLMKQLVKINKKQQQQKQNIPTKVLFSLDQEHRYIHEQLNKIKEQFVKLKQLVRNQYVRQKKEVDDIVRGIISKFQQVIYLRNYNTVETHTQTKMNDNKKSMMNKPTFSLNLDCLKQLKSHDSMPNDFPSMSISEIKPSQIKQKGSIKDSLFELKKVFCDDSVNLQKSLSKISQIKTTEGRHFHKISQTSAKTDRSASANNENARPYPRLSTDRSKKQFQKLFQAVNQLKKDIKDLNSITVSVSSEKSQFTNPLQSLAASAPLNIANEKKIEVPKLSKLAAYKKAKLDAMER